MTHIDIGANLTHESFSHDLPALLARARAASVDRIIVTGASLGLAWTGTDADDALYTNPHGRRLARSTVALTLAQAF